METKNVNNVDFLSDLLKNAGISNGNGTGSNLWDYQKIWSNYKSKKLDIKKEFPKISDFLACKSFENYKKTPRKELQKSVATLKTAYRVHKSEKVLQALKEIHKLYVLDNVSFETFLERNEKE